jgi:hypothetical protein
MKNVTRRAPLVVLLLILILAPGLSSAAAANPSSQGKGVLQRYARDTWASFVAMTDPDTGLPADNLGADGTRSPTRPPPPTQTAW